MRAGVVATSQRAGASRQKPQKQPRLPPGGRPVQIGEVATSWQAGAERRFFTSRFVCQSSAMRDALLIINTTFLLKRHQQGQTEKTKLA